MSETTTATTTGTTGAGTAAGPGAAETTTTTTAGGQVGAPAGGTGSSAEEPDKGFPENTAVAEMNDKQAAAYWRHQARKHEGRATARGDYDAVKAKATKYDQIEADKLTPSEKAVSEAREAGKKEAAHDANQKAATAILRASLKARGKTDEQVTSLVAATNVGAFLTDDDVDTDKVTAYANNIAGPVTGGGSRVTDHGQGQRGSSTRATGVNAGTDMFEASRKKKSGATSTSP